MSDISTTTSTDALEQAPYRLVAFWKEDPRIKKTFLQYSEVQVRVGEESTDEEIEPTYEFFPLVLSRKLEELLVKWQDTNNFAEAIAAQQEAVQQGQKLFNEALDASDNPHCEIFVTQTALNYLTTIDLLFNLVFYADELPLFFDQATVAKTQQTGALYVWLDPYLAGISKRQHKPLDTDEALWPGKEELYCYFKRKSDPTVSPQQLANLWRTNASRIVEIDEECRQKLWQWLKGQRFSEEEIRGLILP